MTIAEVSKQYGLTADTLRYYERVGLLPPVRRTASGLRDYGEEELRWVGFVKCMRCAGMSIETLAEYVALFRQGEDTVARRKALLVEQRDRIQEKINELQAAIKRLDYKIDSYEDIVSHYESKLQKNAD